MERSKKISLVSCLNYLTIHAAHAAGLAEHTGSLEWGKMADFVLLSKSPLSVSAEQIKEIVPLRVVIGGKVVHEYESALSPENAALFSFSAQ